MYSKILAQFPCCYPANVFCHMWIRVVPPLHVSNSVIALRPLTYRVPATISARYSWNCIIIHCSIDVDDHFPQPWCIYHMIMRKQLHRSLPQTLTLISSGFRSAAVPTSSGHLRQSIHQTTFRSTFSISYKLPFLRNLTTLQHANQLVDSR